jgi:hypothetical protein
MSKNTSSTPTHEFRNQIFVIKDAELAEALQQAWTLYNEIADRFYSQVEKNVLQRCDLAHCGHA